MAEKDSKELVIFPASGGLQSANNPALIDFKNLADADNIIFTNDASRTTRPGGKDFIVSGITETENFQHIFDFWRQNTVSGSQNNKVVAVINGKVFADGGGDGIFEEITGSAIIPPTDVVTSDVLGGLMVMGFENLRPKKYNQSGVIEDLGGDPPDGAIFRQYKGFPWLAKIRGRPHGLYRGQFGNAEIWSGPTTESIAVAEGDQDPEGITALFPEFYDDLYVAKRRSIYRVRLESLNLLDTTQTFTVKLFLRGIGCVSHNSAVATQNDIIFASERGVHSLMTTQKYGDAETAFLSAPIHDIYTKQMDFSRAKHIQATYIPELNSYIMVFPKKGAVYNKDVLGINLLNGQWYRWKNVNASVCTVFINGRKEAKLMIGDRDGNIRVFDSRNLVDGANTAINSSFKTGILYPMGSPKRSVTFKTLTVVYRPKGNSNFQCTYSVDGHEIETLNFSQQGRDSTPLGVGFTLGTAKLNFTGDVKVASKMIKGVGRGIQLEFSRQPSGIDIKQGMEILGYMIEFKDAGDSGQSSVQ